MVLALVENPQDMLVNSAKQPAKVKACCVLKLIIGETVKLVLITNVDK